MIVRIFKSGVSKGESVVKYLLGNKDHTGMERAVKPEILEGNQTTIDVIADSVDFIQPLVSLFLLRRRGCYLLTGQT